MNTFLRIILPFISNKQIRFLMLFSLFRNFIMMVVNMGYGVGIVHAMWIRESDRILGLSMREIGNSLVSIGLIIF